MNSYILKNPAGKVIGSACGKCDTMISEVGSIIVSDRCCEPRACIICEKPISKSAPDYLMVHEACRDERRYTALMAAPLVQWPEMVFCDCCDKYFADSDDFVDAHEQRPPGDRVWACDATAPISFDAEALVYNFVEENEHHEDAMDAIVDLKGLQTVLDEWCSRQTLRSYHQSTNAVDVSDCWAEREAELEADDE